MVTHLSLEILPPPPPPPDPAERGRFLGYLKARFARWGGEFSRMALHIRRSGGGGDLTRA